MTEPIDPPDVVDDGVTDVLSDDEVVHVPVGVAALAEEPQHAGETFISDVPHWEQADAG